MIASPLLVGVFAAAALLSLVLLASGRAGTDTYLSDTEAHATHVAMNGVMAAMALPHGMARAEWLYAPLIVAAGVLAVRFVLALRSRDGSAPGTAYHLFATLAMIAAIYWMPAHHGITMERGGGWLASLLGIAFVLDALATAILALALPGKLLALEADLADGGPRDTPAARRAVRLAAVPHLVMDAGMAAMLF